MLQAFSDRIRNSRWLGYLIVAVISVPFALWGVQAYFTGAAPDEVAEVNGSPISTQLFDRQVGERRQELRERFDGELPDDFDDMELRRRVLDELIDREVIAQAAASLGMIASDQRVAQMIRSQEFFQRDGQFDPELYRQVLSRSGIRPSEYEADMRRSDRVQQLQGGVMGSAFTLPSEARHLATLEGQQREVSVVRIADETLLGRVSVSDDEVRAFYDANAERFQTPRQRRVAYLELDRDALAETIDVTAEEIEAEYRERVQREEEESVRHASHILLELEPDADPERESEVRRRLEELRERIVGGEDFAELAREYSNDPASAPDGGDLGAISPGEMVDEFDDALFALEEEAALSEPVRTRFGYHLIQVTHIDEPEGPTLADLRDEIRRDLQQRQAEEFFFDRVDALVNAAYENPGSLEPAAEASGLEIRESEWMSRESGEGIGGHPAIREAAFVDEGVSEGYNSDVIELDDRHVAVIRLLEEQEPEPIPFDEVEESVREELQSAQIEELRNDWLREVRERLDAGESLDELAARDEPAISIDGPDSVRFGDAAEVAPFEPSVLDRAFALPVPDDTTRPSVDEVEHDGRPALVVVHEVEYPEPTTEHVAQFEHLLERVVTNAEMGAWMATLRSQADIEINERRLRRGARDQ